MQAGFWDFTLDFYGGEGVSETLVRLQDECGLDVNLLLLAVWRGLQGRELADGPGAEAAIATWRQQVTEPLRALRRRLKQADWTGLPDPLRQQAEGPFRDRVKDAELDSEKLTQAVLEALPAGAAGALPADRAVAANLAAIRRTATDAAAAARAEALCQHLAQAALRYAPSS
ncbi:MAG: TIGR02444 family protein [Sneathiellaceae bacterium]